MSRFHDISVSMEDGMVGYPGDPPVSIRRVGRVEDGAAANLSLYSLGSHAGTHVDPPFHLYPAGGKADELPLDALIGRAVVVQVRGGGIGRTYLAGSGIEGKSRVLFKTDGPGPAHLAPDAASYLVDMGVRLVGMDGLSVDEPGSSELPAHRVLLGAGVVILEGLDLSGVRPGEYELICLPLKVKGGDGAPARAVLVEVA